MSKTLLVGPAGCGKTHQLLDLFSEALSSSPDPLAEDLFFIVPSAEHTERVISLLIQQGLKGFFHKRVTTLSRLANDVFRVTDIPVASSLTRTMIVKDLFRENAWEYFSEVREQPGFVGLMAQFVTELKEACISSEVFRERMNALKSFEPAYAEKYEALADFYEQYEIQLKKQGLRDSQDALRIFRERQKKTKAPVPRFKAVWIDGFFDFSNLQLEYLKELSGITENIVITLTREEGECPEGAFESIDRTRQDLEKLGFQSQSIKPGSYRTEKPALLFLQKNLFKGTGSPPKAECLSPLAHSRKVPGTVFCEKGAKPHEPAPKDIVIFNAIGTEGEMELIAREIHKLYATGKYRYSDFAVLFRQIGHYAPVILSVFARYGTPVEIHERDRLKFSSWIAATASLLSIFQNGWQREDLFSFLRSGHVRYLGKDIANPNSPSKDSKANRTSPGNLQPKENKCQDKRDEWITVLEQSSFREGVAEGRDAWLADWKFEGSEDREALNKKKIEMLKALADLEEKFRGAKTADEHARIFKRAVYETFGILEISNRYTSFVRRDAACVRRFEALLDEIQSYFMKASKKKGVCHPREGGDPGSGSPIETFGNDSPSEHIKDKTPETSFESFADHFLGLVELDVYSLHERDKNRVQVYDVSLARQKEYKVVFVAGLLEKVFPMQVREDPLLSDWERKLMNGSMAYPLAERLPRQNIERFLFYLAVTRARECLYLSYPHLDFEGKESLPSFYLEEVKILFGGRIPVVSQDLARPFPAVDEAVTRRELESSVAGVLRNAGTSQAALRGLLEKLAGDPGSRERFLSALIPVETKIADKKILEGGYFKIQQTSPTRLETYAKCPYRYFADKVLRLKDDAGDIRAMQKGSVLHHVLQQYFDPKSHSPSKNMKETLENFIMREMEEGLKQNPMTWTEPYQEDLDRRELFEMLLDFLQYETERLEHSSFKPLHVEYSFGGPNTDSIGAERRLGQSKLPLGKEMKSLDDSGETGTPCFEVEGAGRKIKLRGRIDRVDTDSEKKYAVVIDYKRSAKFKAADLGLGTALQLPLYLLVAQKNLGLKPLGAAIYSIRGHKRSGFYHEGSAKGFEKEFSSRSQLPDEVFQKVLDRALAFVRKFMKGIESSEISARPRECESFCPYDTVCRIEKWKLPIILEEILEEDKKAGLREESPEPED